MRVEAHQRSNGSADPGGRLYIIKTLRSMAVVTAFVLFLLVSYGQWWAIAPVLAGAALAVVLLAGLDGFVRWLFTPERLRGRFAAGKAGAGGMPLLAFAAVKYPLVALLLWGLVRAWDIKRLMAFVGGFILLHLVIVSRALGRLVTGDKVDTV
jgi:hypothetical protein